ncbi:MAG: hypothetical protein HY360_00615 [Verrucomicrobia bacterium]|nr:hypothetical protein [Verrucomicrobiota bacterium]
MSKEVSRKDAKAQSGGATTKFGDKTLNHRDYREHGEIERAELAESVLPV